MPDARLIDVADAAGVSLRTASRVLNDDSRVADATRDRVHEAMRTLAFEPDAMARSLRAGTDTAVGFVVESIADPFFAAMIDAVEAEMALHGRPVLVASHRRDDAREREIVRRMVQRRVAGLLVVPTTGTVSWVAEATVPTVCVDRGPEHGADLIDIDNHAAAAAATRHLLEHGHERIAYLGDDPAVPTSGDRLRGYFDTMRAAGTTVPDALVVATGTTSSDAAAATRRLLDLPRAEAPTAIFSATTRASLGVVPTLHREGRTDIALVGLGDFDMADALKPGVTVIDHSGQRLGEAAARRLLTRIASPALAVEHRRLDAPLITRGSGEQRP